MNIGDYVRTKDGIIDKVIIDYKGHCANPSCNYKHVSCKKNYYNEEDILKSSPDIIDLIEVGDYVDDYRVEKKENELGIFIILENCKSKWLPLKGMIIKSIVTKEQFASMEYRIRR